MTSEGSVTQWITEFKEVDDEAAQKLWQRYYERLLYLCRRHLGDRPRRVADEEDVALSAFNNLFQAIQQNRYPQLCDREDLWKLLLVIGAREASHQKEHESRKKRGGGRVRTESTTDADGSFFGDADFDKIVGKELTPEFIATMAEQVERLLQQLGDANLQRIAQMKMEGYTNKEIADDRDLSLRDVERKLKSIREQWSLES